MRRHPALARRTRMRNRQNLCHQACPPVSDPSGPSVRPTDRGTPAASGTAERLRRGEPRGVVRPRTEPTCERHPIAARLVMTSLRRPQDAADIHHLGQGRRTRVADIVRRQSQGASTGSARRAAAEERRESIVSAVRARGNVLVSDLAEFLGISEPTLLRDLSVLERMNVLRRTRDGAVVAGPCHAPSASIGRERRSGAHAQFARLCMDLISEEQTIFLDSGRVSHALAEALGRSRVSVLTNALGVAVVLAERHAAHHVLLGGELCPTGRALVGPVAAATLERFTVDIAFITVSGVTSHGISVPATAEGHIKQVAMARARRVVVVAEAPAIGRDAFFCIAGLEDVDDIVCDLPQPDLVRWCRAHDVRLHYVEQGSEVT
ncbi:DeoR/GlpR family DNA-binding transcription regulator [Streptomyces sp. NPDC085946]|uniref:DeoR/GlpR family DNA-binding transcription regulator n=1 Tax=Streptomyces sp. NPDC085946 TaxID=3365744 RepID=UPI0037D281D7